MNNERMQEFTRREFLARASALGVAPLLGADWRFLNEIKRELKA